MDELPDGSGFFVGTVGPREAGVMNWLKYNRCGSARLYLFRWRMFWTARELSRLPDQGPPMGVIHAALYALSLP